MKQRFRLPAGGRIDRERPVNFRFDGRPMQGYAGDTLASALLANGVRMVARSFKFHRPRGIVTAGEEEPVALVQVGDGAAREPSCRVTQVLLTEGLSAHSQSGWPSLRLDAGRVFDVTWPLWPAGFYHKTFKWPRWQFWEGSVRRLTGLGRTPDGPDPDHYEQVNAHCDLLICGGGPAGLMAALVAGRAGARVLLAELDHAFGGSLNAERTELDGRPAADWVDEVVGELKSMPRVVLLPRTAVLGIYDHHVATLLQRGESTAWRECLWTVRPRRVLLATGSAEQGMIFPDNDRPGIMLAGAVRHYLNRYAVAAGRAAVVATNNDSAYQTVLDLTDREIPVAAVADLRQDVHPDIDRKMGRLGVPVFRSARIGGTRGARAVTEARIESLDGTELGRFGCDLLGISGGWSARVHLLCHAGGRLRFDSVTQCFLPDQLPAGMAATGSAAGHWGLERTLAEAESVARSLCETLGLNAHHAYRPRTTRAAREPGRTVNVPPRPHRRRQWIDLAHDVTLGDAELAVREGYDAVEHFKRYTTAGMSVDQGKTANLHGFLALSALTGRPIDRIGTTSFRPPYLPVTLGAVAGRRSGDFYVPRRLLPAQLVHESLGARFEEYAGWQRPEYYGARGAERQSAIRREVLAVRRGAGVFDNSPIGKIDVQGPDAATFLDRFYINDVHSLAVGRCRYGLMLDENGVIIDDGVFIRLAEDRYLVNTTSGNAARILARFEEWRQCEWPGLDLMLADVTAQWASFTVAGPRAPELIRSLRIGLDLSSAALPHMAAAEGSWAGDAARVARVSFSGEVSYEISVPARRAVAMLSALLGADRQAPAEPYGIEALMTLRLEKGYLHVGTDTDGQTTPDDVGWGHVARKKERDYIGRRSLWRAANTDPDRRQLVGIEVPADQPVPRAGSHLLLTDDHRAESTTDGWITSAAFSPTLGRPIALAMLRGGRSRLGAPVTVHDQDARYLARVVNPCFHDPANARLQS